MLNTTSLCTIYILKFSELVIPAKNSRHFNPNKDQDHGILGQILEEELIKLRHLSTCPKDQW